jgi:hypothetical protein
VETCDVVSSCCDWWQCDVCRGFKLWHRVVQEDYVGAFAEVDFGEEGCAAVMRPVCVKASAFGEVFAAGAAAVVVGGFRYVLGGCVVV